jgi:hypothetical protein
MRIVDRMRLVLVVCLLAPMPYSVGELSVESGSIRLEESGIENVRKIETGERVTLPAVIRSGSGQAVLRLDEATFVALDPGAVIEASYLDDTLHLVPQVGLIVVHARRTGVNSPGVQVEYLGSRLRVHDGTLGLMIGDDAILIRMLLRGQGFEMSRDDVYLTELGAPSMFMISEAAALEVVELRDLIRPDQIRLNSVAVGSATLLADRLEAGQDGLRSADLGSVLESMRLVRFRMNREESSRVVTILVNAARREWSTRAGQDVELPELIRIPEAVAPWDRAIRTWME